MSTDDDVSESSENLLQCGLRDSLRLWSYDLTALYKSIIIIIIISASLSTTKATKFVTINNMLASTNMHLYVLIKVSK